jgi:hypothetical protein
MMLAVYWIAILTARDAAPTSEHTTALFSNPLEHPRPFLAAQPFSEENDQPISVASKPSPAFRK